MKSLTNLYVYDGKNVPYIMTNDTQVNKVATNNLPVKSNNIAPQIVTAYITDTDIYIKPQIFPTTEKPISIEENSAFYIIFNGNPDGSGAIEYGKTFSGLFKIHGLNDPEYPIPFGTCFKDNGDAFPMQITTGDVYLCCYVKNSWQKSVPASDRVLASKIGRADNGVVEFDPLVTKRDYCSIKTPYDGLYTIYIATGLNPMKQYMFTVSCFNSYRDFPTMSGPTIDGITVQYVTSNVENDYPRIMITGLPTGDIIKTYIKCYCKLY